MTNTYAITTIKGQEFSVEAKIQEIGLKPWVGRRLVSKWVKEANKWVWHDVPYAETLLFCVIPSIYWTDVRKIKGINGKPDQLSRADLGRDGDPPWPRLVKIPRRDGSTYTREASPTLRDYMGMVRAEYQDMERKKANAEYQCQYVPGQALHLLDGMFEGKEPRFKEVVRQGREGIAKLRLEMEMFGQVVAVDVDPDRVRAAE